MPAAPKTSNVVSIRVVNFSNTIFNFLARFSMITLGKSKVNCSWHIFTVSILEVLNNFMKNLFITKSNDFKSVLVNGQTSKQYSRIGKHLLFRELTFTFAICYRPSVCLSSVVCLSVVCLSVTFVRPTQAVQIFGNISTALGT